MSDYSGAATAAAAILLAGSTLFSDGRPPDRYVGNASFVVEIHDQKGIESRCQPLFGVPPEGMKTDACSTDGRVIMPNPCNYPASDSYARMLCHELGHVNGWPMDHGD